MLKKAFNFLLIISLAMGLTSAASAQRQTGSIKGKVVDWQGYPLPGAFIYVSSPSLLGLRTCITTDAGRFRIPGLPPGQYKIMVEMPGFKTAKITEITAQVGMTVTLSITLEAATIEEEISVKLPSPTLDAESTKTAEVIEEQLLSNIPFSRNFYNVINSAAGVIPEESIYQDNSSVHGSSVRDNTYAFEGMIMNDPAGRHLLTAINLDLIEEAELETAAHPAELGGTGGGYINVITKSGGKSLSGGVNLYYTDDTMSSYLRSKEEMSSPQVSPPAKEKNLWDFAFSLGGSLFEDMLWFFGDIRLFSLSKYAPFIPWTADPQGNPHRKFSWKDNQSMGFFKLSSQFIPQLKVAATFNSVGRFQSAHESTLSWNIPEEATRVLDHEKNYTASGTLNYIIDQNTFADLKGGYSYNRTPLRLNDNGAEKIEYFDAGTGRLWGSNGYNETRKRTRLQLGAYLTRYQDGLLAGNHELKAGAEYEYASGEWAIWKKDNLMINYYNGSPYYFGLDESPLTGTTVGKGKISFSIASQEEFPFSQKSDLRRLSFFAQDSVTFGDRLTLFIGLRLDRSSTGLFNLVKGESGNPVSLKLGEEIILAANGVNPYAENGTFDWKDVMTWNSLSPRVGLSFDLSGKGKTIFKASYARYSEYIMLDYIFSLSPNYPRRVHQFNWFDEDMDGEVDTDDTFTLYPEDYRLYSEEYYKKQIDPGIKPPYTDEFTIGLSQELGQDFSIRVSFIYKTKGNILENVLYDPDLDKDWYTTGQDTENWWIPFRTIVPSVDAYPETAVTAYYWSNSAPPLFYRIKNVPELKKKYRALELVFKKRMSNNWQLDGSLVLSKATGNIGLGYDSSSGFSDAADNPNYFINLPEDSRLDLDRPFMAKLMGTYKFPFDLFLNFYYTYASGAPWARSITIIPPSSWLQNENAYSSPARVYLEKPGTRRTEAYNNLDLRIEKEFRLRGSGKFSVSVDVLNALGKKSSFNFPNDDGFWFPEAESTNQGIREISPNYLKTALLSGLRIFRLNLSLNF